MLSTRDSLLGMVIASVMIAQSFFFLFGKGIGMSKKVYRFLYKSDEIADLYIKIGSILGIILGVICFLLCLLFYISNMFS